MNHPVPLVLIGGGGHCKACIDVIESTGNFRIIGIVDKPKKVGGKIMGYSIFADDENLKSVLKATPSFLVTLGQVGSGIKRQNLFNLAIRSGGKPATIVSSTAHVARGISIGEGSIIMHHAMVNSDANIGNNCIVNSKTLIEHDAYIDDDTVLSTGVILNGGVKTGKNVFIGTGTILFQSVTVGNNSCIGGGLTIRSDIPSDSNVYKNTPR